MSRTTRVGLPLPLAILSLLILSPIGRAAATDSGLSPTVAAPQGTSDPAAVDKDAGSDVHSLLEAGRTAEAERIARALLAKAEAGSDPESMETARALDLVVECRWTVRQAANPETRAMAQRALDIKRKLRGPEDPELAVSLRGFGRVLSELGDFAGARSAFEGALKIQERSFGTNSLPTAPYLSSLGTLLTTTGEYALARPILERAVALREKADGPEAAATSTSLSDLASLLATVGEAQAAIELFERAVRIDEARLEADNPHLATAYGNLAVAYEMAGFFDQAMLLQQRSLAIREKALGPDSPDVAMSLNNLAILEEEMGDFVSARSSYTRALAINEEAYGHDHSNVATSLMNLGELLGKMGDDEAARPLYERALSIYEARLGPEHPNVALTLTCISILDESEGRYPAARTAAERALAIQEKNLGPEHPDLAWGLAQLGRLAAHEGDLASARRCYDRSLSIREKQLGPDHPLLATTLSDYAVVLTEKGYYEEARPLHSRSLSLRENFLGPDHPEVAQSLEGIGQLDLATNDPAGALAAGLRAGNIQRRQFQLTSRSLTEREALDYQATMITTRDLVLSATMAGTGDSTCPGQAWDAIIGSRCLVLDEMVQRNRVLAAAGDTTVAHLLDTRARLVAKLASLFSRQTDFAAFLRDSIRSVQEREDGLDQQIADKSAEFRHQMHAQEIGLAAVAPALSAGDALVAYAYYGRLTVVPSGWKRVPSCAVFVLRPGGSPVAHDLGSSAEIDSLVASWRREMRPVSGPMRRNAEAEYRKVGVALYRKIWAIVAQDVAGASRVFVVPDGSLSLLNFATLPTGPDRYLVESDAVIHHLSSERDLVADRDSAEKGAGILIVGGPDYDSPQTFALQSSGRGGSSPLLASALSPRPAFRGPTSAELRSLKFEPLPASREEAQELAGLFRRTSGSPLGDRIPGESVTVLVGGDASEEALKQEAPGKRILHLATHGFVLVGDPEANGASRSRTEGKGTPALGSIENPLLVTGLALAGANRRHEAGPDAEDGILTAEEIGAMDLSGVEWAVLSACDTGAGVVKAGEGVFGLRRAFQIAGVRTLVMSLWPVEDESAREWMRALYGARLQRGLRSDEAVRAASLAVLRESRADGLSGHPYYWGGFVAAGDPR